MNLQKSTCICILLINSIFFPENKCYNHDITFYFMIISDAFSTVSKETYFEQYFNQQSIRKFNKTQVSTKTCFPYIDKFVLMLAGEFNMRCSGIKNEYMHFILGNLYKYMDD